MTTPAPKLLDDALFAFVWDTMTDTRKGATAALAGFAVVNLLFSWDEFTNAERAALTVQLRDQITWHDEHRREQRDAKAARAKGRAA